MYYFDLKIWYDVECFKFKFKFAFLSKYYISQQKFKITTHFDVKIKIYIFNEALKKYKFFALMYCGG